MVWAMDRWRRLDLNREPAPGTEGWRRRLALPATDGGAPAGRWPAPDRRLTGLMADYDSLSRGSEDQRLVGSRRRR